MILADLKSYAAFDTVASLVSPFARTQGIACFKSSSLDVNGRCMPETKSWRFTYCSFFETHVCFQDFIQDCLFGKFLKIIRPFSRLNGWETPGREREGRLVMIAISLATCSAISLRRCNTSCMYRCVASCHEMNLSRNVFF